ncbi:unnamed protein product [Lepeophtheirus salmonis]|uniref:(salmon louse) hypothetical protein n=1 Tax=Lepeophtheirus salmonis TaxID=72036 RepID=A0A7R8D4F1_LEPSM|nr:unnamed protein product [Lepeophtheirus salmonis]CAF3023363.1 unnamed protein product [Lepeophtheirus salmonis]
MSEKRKNLFPDEGEESDDSTSSSSSTATSASSSSSTSSCNTVTDEIPSKDQISFNVPPIREGSPVFYLDPVDWLRVEGSSPIPPRLLHSTSTPPTSSLLNTSNPHRRKSSGLKSLHILYEREGETECGTSSAPTSVTTPPDVTVSLPSSGSFASLLGGYNTHVHDCKRRRRKINIPILCSRAGCYGRTLLFFSL